MLLHSTPFLSFFFFFNDTATTEIYTLSLHDALPISQDGGARNVGHLAVVRFQVLDHHLVLAQQLVDQQGRSEEHTSELQSPCNLVCRLLLEKKKKKKKSINICTCSETQLSVITLTVS